MAKKRLGEILLERGLIDVDQLNSALAYHRQWGHRLGASMVAKGFIREGTLTRVLSEALQIPMVDLAKVIPDDKALALIKPTHAEEHEIFPIAVKEHKGRKTLLLAMADPLNVAAVDEVAFTTDMTVRPAIAQITSLRAAIRRYYHREQIHIPPLDFGPPRKGVGGSSLPPDEVDRMTITVGGSEREVVIDDESGDVIDLTKEVEAAEQSTGSGMVQITNASTPPTAGTGTADPFAMVASSATHTYYQGQPTGAYMMAVPAATPPPMQSAPPQNPRLSLSVDAPPGAPIETPHEALEKKFWALMRILARKGLLTREEFIEELARES